MSKYTYELQLRDSRRSSWWTDYGVNSLFITKDEKIDAAKKWKRIWGSEDFRVVRALRSRRGEDTRQRPDIRDQSVQLLHVPARALHQHLK